MSEPTSPLYYERTVAEILGISRTDFSFLRKTHLEKKEGWLMHGRDLVLTKAGLAQILVHVKASLNTANATLDFARALVPQALPEKNEGGEQDAEPADAADPPPESPAAPELLTLTVTRTYPNQRLLQAMTPAGAVVDVMVRNNRNFVPRMTLHARLNKAGKYEMEGRCPRTRGRY